MPQRFPDLGKLSIAILEHLVKPVIGERALAEIKSPLTAKEDAERVRRALSNAEQRFTAEHTDKRAAQLVLNLPLASLPSVSVAVIAFYHNPADAGLAKILREQIGKDAHRLSPAQIDAAADAYVRILRAEFINLSQEFRGKSSAYAVVETAEHMAEMAEGIKEIARKISPPDAAQLKTLSALHSLPSPPADFTGRADELQQLLAHFPSPTGRGARGEGSTALVTGLSGMGGVGKTALALVAAHKLAPEFPDAQIYLDLKGTSTGGVTPPLQPRDAMQFTIHAFEPQADLRQASDDEIAALYRSLLNGKRARLLMDNAADAAQCKPLVPPPTCALLVTSRKHFTLAGSQPIRLDVLNATDARDLLLKLAPRLSPSPEHRGRVADEIARLCGYLPLALRIAGSALAEHVDIAPADYIARLQKQRLALLKSEDDPDANVERTFAFSYELLTDEKKKHWRARAVFPAPFDVSAAATVLAMDADAARDLLSEFVRLSLLNYTTAVSLRAERSNPQGGEEIASSQKTLLAMTEGGHYFLHDLLQEFATARLPSDEHAAAHLRHAQHYLEIARRADQIYEDGKQQEGLAVFDFEWQNIKAGQQWAAANSAGATPAVAREAARLCNEFPDASTYCLSLRLTPRERIAWLETATTAAHKLNQRAHESAHLGNLGLAYADLGDTRRAIEFYEQALTISRETGDRRSEGAALGNLGNAYADLSETRRAIEFYEQALAIAREISDRRNEGVHAGNLGRAYADLGETRHAIEFYEQALAIAREIGDRRGEGNHLGNLGTAHFLLDEIQNCITYYEQGLAIAREIGDRQTEGEWLGGLGIAYRNLGETRRAIEFYEQALAIAREIANRRGEGNHLGNLGNAYATLGETRRAIEFYEQALAIAREIGDRRNEGAWLGNLGHAYADLGETRRAIEFVEQALKIFEAIESPYAERARKQLEELRGK